jgi:prolyl oligopeptidase
VPAGEEAYWSAVYEHRLGSGAPARRVFGDDHVKEYWSSVKVSECGRFAVLYKWDFVHANVAYLLRLADDGLVPVAPAMRSINRVRVIGDSLLVLTDLDAPRGRPRCASSTSTSTSSSTGSTGASLEAAALPFCRLMQHAVATTQKPAK